MRKLLLVAPFAAWLACSEFTATSQDTSDAGAEASPADTCTRIVPVETFVYNAALLDSTQPAQAVVCAPENALAEDGKVTGLDRRAAGSKAKVNDVYVAGCVAARFADEVVLRDVSVTVAPIGNACDASPCVEGDVDAGCGTERGLQVELFSGPTLNDLTGHVNPSYGAAPATLSYRVVDGAHFVVACRGGEVAVTRDDVGIDAIYASCP